MNIKHLVSLLGFALVMVFGSIASADDYGVHARYDVRTNLSSRNNVDLRLVPELFFTDNSRGLQQMTARFGPTYAPNTWLTLGFNGYVAQTWNQDVRLEFQPEVGGRLNDYLTVNDRNRLSVRVMDSAVGNRWNYANELRLNLDHGCDWSPFVSDEVFVGLSNSDGISQNRLVLGMNYKLNANNNVDFGYMLRSNNNTTSWSQDHMLVLSVNTNR